MWQNLVTCETFEGEKETFSDPASWLTTFCHARARTNKVAVEMLTMKIILSVLILQIYY